jgi:nuclear pore complex protein Nup93
MSVSGLTFFVFHSAALLGSVGLDLPRVAHKLDVLSTISNFEPLEPIRETDIKGFLKNERENAILAVIEETRRMVKNQAL